MNAGSELQFVDTNLLVYAHDRSAGQKYARAEELVASLWENRTGALSIQVLQEFYVTVTQKVSRPLSPEAASRIILGLSHWSVHTPLVSDILEAGKILQQYRLSFRDAMIVRSAQALGCSVLWTEDLNPDQVYGNLRVCNPFSRT